MSEKVKLILLGVGWMAAGAAMLARRKHMSRRLAEGVNARALAERFKFDYSEGFFRGLYLLGGTLLVMVGAVFLVKSLGGAPGSTLHKIEGYLAGALVAVAFGGGLVFIIYSNLKYGGRKK